MSQVQIDRDLTRKYFIEGDKTAFDGLLLHAKKIFVSALKKYYVPTHLIEDGYQELCIDLWKNVGKFDITQNDNFLAYSSKHIQKHIICTVMSQVHPHISSSDNKLFRVANMINKGVDLVDAQKRHSFITPALIERTKYQTGMKFHEINDVNNTVQLIDNDMGIPDRIDQYTAYQAFLKVISILPEKDQKLIRQYYNEGRTLKQIADDEGITPQAIDYRLRTVHNKIRRMVAKSGKEDGLRCLEFSGL